MAVIGQDNILPLALSTLPDEGPLRHPSHVVALILHAINTRLGYRVKYDGEGFSDSDEIAPEWTSERDNSVKLDYINQEKQPIRMRVTAEFGGRILVTVEGDHIGSSLPFGLSIAEYFDPSAFPFTPPPPAVGRSGPSPLLSLFTTPNKANDLIQLYHNNVVKSLVDSGAAKFDFGSGSATPHSGAATSPTSSSGRIADRKGYYSDKGGPLGISPQSQQQQQQPYHIGAYAQPSVDLPKPTFGGVPAPSRGGAHHGQANPFSVGQSDLDPLGGRPAGFPGFPGSSGPSFGGGGDGGGMFMGPGHPLFGGGVGGGRFGGQGGGGGMGGSGLWGGDGYLPGGAVPPGARFDPVGPMNGPPGGGVGGQPARGRGAGGPLGLGSRDPDWNGQPPSRNNDYDNMFG